LPRIQVPDDESSEEENQTKDSMKSFRVSEILDIPSSYLQIDQEKETTPLQTSNDEPPPYESIVKDKKEQ